MAHYGQPVRAYPVQGGEQYPQAQEAHPPHQPYGQSGTGGNTVVAQPYNGPTAQQAVTGRAGNQQHVVIVRQGHGTPGAGQVPPSDYCCISWFSCLFCCLPIGLFAICMSSSVNSKWRRGDFDGAYRASELAKKAAIGAILIGIMWQISVAVVESNVVENNNSSNGNNLNDSSIN